MSAAPVRIGLIGLGTVGQGLVRLLARNRDEYARRLGRPLVITHAAARDRARRRDCDLSGITLVDDPAFIAREAPVDVVVELVGGISPARELLLEAMARGKAVVTANKALLAEDGNRMFAAARDAGVALGFEAAVAGGIPIIRVLREGLAGNRLQAIAGIINGTSNYILSQMTERGMEFSRALAEAQSLGYAEADPRFDVEGIDAAHKLTILATLAFGMPLTYSAVAAEGITRVTARDIELAHELGYRIKPLAIAKRGAGGVELRVHPTLVPHEHLLAKVDGVLNSILVQGDAVGPTGYYGRGAGGDATASAVVSDLLEVAREHGVAAPHRPHALGFDPGAMAPLPLVPREQVQSAHYVRLQVADTPGVLKGITSILAELDISIEAILQKEPRGRDDATLAIITSVIGEQRFAQAMAKLLALPFVRPGSTHLRVEHFDGA
ncbi:MAG TPA: homoserine dehydrogenase [Candidatus Binatia bacterium]|nr:homoserine dehydrogenase [Candidatus Binatia bacterium]